MGKISNFLCILLKPYEKMSYKQEYLTQNVELKKTLNELKEKDKQFQRLKDDFEKIKNIPIHLTSDIDEDNDLQPVDLTDIDPDELVFQDTIDFLLTQIPDGWLLYEAGQSPMNSTWICQLVEFESMVTETEQDVPHVIMVYSDQNKSFKEALNDCLTKIENEEYVEDV